MFALFSRFLDLALMRLPPQAFPASRFLLGLVLLAYLLTSLAGNHVLSGDMRYSIARALLSAFNLAAAAAFVLALARRRERWLQAATALFGGETVIGLALLPVLLVNAAGIQNLFILLSMLAFLAWELVFLAHVYRNALDARMGAGMLIAVLYVIATSLIKQQLVPFPAN